MSFARIYGEYVKLYIKGAREYRAAFILYQISIPFGLLVSYASIWIILTNFTDASGGIAGWSIPEFVLLFAINATTASFAAILYWNTVLQLGYQIREGTVDVLLLRPMGLIKQLVCYRLGDVFLSEAVVGVGFVVAAAVKLHGQMTLFSYLFLLLTIAGAFLFQSGAMILLGSLSFWHPKSDQFAFMMYYSVRSFIQYPLSIFPVIIQVILTCVVPYAFINYYPCLIILHKAQTGLQTALGLISPLVGAGVFLLSLLVFRFGCKRYTGTGS